MRPSNKSRSRNKSGNNPNRRNVGNIINRVFESAGPDGKVRGTPQQIIDKYQALARDAQVSGDRVAAENYSQHAEHYTRLLGEAQQHMSDGRDRDDRDGRDDTQPRDRVEGYDRFQQPPREHRPEQPSRQPEPSGLTTLGADDAYEEAGPIETPEEMARRRSEAAGPREPAANGALRSDERRSDERRSDERRSDQQRSDQQRSDEPRPDDPRPEGAGKRPRTRRKAKPAIETAEAGAE